GRPRVFCRVKESPRACRGCQRGRDKMDNYAKGILTVIAAALIILVIQNFIPNAKAQLPNGGCGLTERTPCYLATAPPRPLGIISATLFPRQQAFPRLTSHGTREPLHRCLGGSCVFPFVQRSRKFAVASQRSLQVLLDV